METQREMTEYGTIVDDTTGMFRLQNKRLMLTYKTHLNVDIACDFFKKLGTPKLLWLAHETGQDGTYDHTHILVEYTKAINTRNCRFFDISDIHPNIKKVTTPLHWKNCLKYMIKEKVFQLIGEHDDAPKSRHQDPEAGGTSVPEVASATSIIWNCESLSEALAAFPLKMATQVKTVWEARPSKLHHDFVTDFNDTWHRTLEEKLNEEPSPRKVIWIYDQVGNSGKTHFIKAYMANYGVENCLPLTQLSGTYHMATVLANMATVDMRVIFCDIPRENEGREGMYASLEAIKNGFITATKYQGKTIFFNKCHVVVMANFLPEFDKMSLDRWDIYHLNMNPEYRILEMTSLTLNEARQLERYHQLMTTMD